MEPAPKRARAEASPLDSPLSEGLLLPSAQDVVRERYTAAHPYSYAVIERLCDAERMALIKQEITRNLRADFKETDLFKLYQTMDLANLSLTHADVKIRELSAKLPQLLALRNALYTQQFRAYMQWVTGCPELTDRVDMAASIFTQGCHLLCHDDVIGTRAVSFIIYLSDDDWQLADGGALELYPLHGQDTDASLQQGVPAAHPAVNILPQFNTMAIFGVKPGRSYHSVQEVYANRTPRLSIQGWYHAAMPPPDIEKASLTQLKSSGSTDSPGFTPLPGVMRYPEPESGAVDSEPAAAATAGAAADGKSSASEKGVRVDRPRAATAELEAYAAAWTLSDADKQFLAEWVHPTYLKEESFEALRKEFAQEGSVQLQKFLCTERCHRLTALLAARDNTEFSADKWPAIRPKPKYTDGLSSASTADVEGGTIGGDGWNVVGPAHMQRYLRFGLSHKVATDQGARQDRPCQAGKELATIKDELFGSVSFARLMYAMTGLRPVGMTAEARRFRPGLDYTVAHHGLLEQEARLDATLSFAVGGGEGDTNEAAAFEAWESGGVGAYECYIAADDEELTAAEVYGGDEDEGNQLLSVPPTSNTLNLVMRDEGTMKFVKYVSHAAPSSRWDIAAVYQVDQDDTDSDDDDELEGQ